MKHIGTIILFGALLQACGEHRKTEVTNKTIHKVHTETRTSAPVASAQNHVAVVPAKAPVRHQVLRHSQTKAHNHSAMKSDEVNTGRAAPLIQTKKKPLRAMTFNEAQFSDNSKTFPRSAEALKLEEAKYND